jgi:EAL domain-containing protein (putative c-di-GMP-specific phosphodiesterase class I)
MIKKSAIRILVLDDDPFMLKLLGHVLAGLDYTRVSCYENGAVALASLAPYSGMPDVILLDINMPEMDGIEFVRHLAECHYTGSLILVSGEDERMLQATEKLARLHHLIVLGSLSKPPTSAGLSTLLEKWIPPVAAKPDRMNKTYTAEALHAAIAKGELINYYQPKVSVLKGAVIGVETLVRWQHPEDGLVFPDCFIPMAEADGLIGELTRVVLRQALQQARTWQDAGLVLRIAVNLSMDDLADVDFANFIVAEVQAAGVPPQSMVLEVTETRLMQNLTIALDVLTRLRLKRFRLSIDDFGTGHSSLAQLRDIPFDELKIDRGFTHHAGQDARLRTIFEGCLHLANQLGMEVVAEGVEDDKDWAFLRTTGCHLAQGYFIARPMPAEALSGWIDAWQQRFKKAI